MDKDSTKASNGYYYHYSYQYPWIRTWENTLATCHFNEKSWISLSDNLLKISQPQSFRVLRKTQIKALHLSFKRLFLPLVIGGITAPLALVALYSNILVAWTALSIVLLGSFLFYYGLRGVYQLKVELYGSELNVFLDEKSQEMEEFVKMTNRILQMQ
ncbi:hypothetical protein AAG747_03125 [Rapidithrix thailandica]|uniref:Uncharacterized protein n=1 Tax=Rapidithrix thailandica TaxID=413964 RepID=A0AAW9S192_9BACT